MQWNQSSRIYKITGCKMEIYIGILIVLTTMSSLGRCTVDYINHSQNVMNRVVEGTSVTISCHFNGNKPPGPSRWRLNGEVIAVDCLVNAQGNDIIIPTDNCSPDPGNGYANYSFVIKKVLLDRDKESWTCHNTGITEKLDMSIAVTNNTEQHNGKDIYTVEEDLNITATIGCSYPPGEVLWCLDDGTEIKCSNQTDWADGVFVSSPVISQTKENCINYKSQDVLSYKSTIKGTITDAALHNISWLFYIFNGIAYKKNASRVLPKDNTRFASSDCGKGLPIATATVETVFLIILIYHITSDYYGPGAHIQTLLSATCLLRLVDLISMVVSIILYIITLQQCSASCSSNTYLVHTVAVQTSNIVILAVYKIITEVYRSKGKLTDDKANYFNLCFRILWLMDMLLIIVLVVLNIFFPVKCEDWVYTVSTLFQVISLLSIVNVMIIHMKHTTSTTATKDVENSDTAEEEKEKMNSKEGQ